MSTIACEKCGALLIDSDGRGFITGCAHHPLDVCPMVLTAEELRVVIAYHQQLLEKKQ